LCSRSIASQSNDFQTRWPSCRPSRSSASTQSSIRSMSIAKVEPAGQRNEQRCLNCSHTVLLHFMHHTVSRLVRKTTVQEGNVLVQSRHLRSSSNWSSACGRCLSRRSAADTASALTVREAHIRCCSRTRFNSGRRWRARKLATTPCAAAPTIKRRSNCRDATMSRRVPL
jgi:hypothetical protein